MIANLILYSTFRLLCCPSVRLAREKGRRIRAKMNIHRPKNIQDISGGEFTRRDLSVVVIATDGLWMSSLLRVPSTLHSRAFVDPAIMTKSKAGKEEKKILRFFCNSCGCRIN